MPGFAQELSNDGNRWYEVEVSVFAHRTFAGGSDAELYTPDKIDPAYPERIRELIPVVGSYGYDFEPPEPWLEIPELDIGTVEAESAFIGPEFSPANPDYRIIDFARDPFVALGSHEHEFTALNAELRRDTQYRLLYHNVWRQPALPVNQATAIFISGGDVYGQHSELEGSVTISLNQNQSRVVVDTLLWRNSFAPPGSESRWIVPFPPFPVSGDGGGDFANLVIDEVYLMSQSREMVSNELHYLDHPAFGMLIEVRPYRLPDFTEADE